MGFRTVVLLANDLAHEWENDPELGKKIARDVNYINDSNERGTLGSYGRVIECTHADSQTLMMLDSYNGTTVAHGHWHRGQNPNEAKLALLRDMADRLGYRISKKPEGK